MASVGNQSEELKRLYKKYWTTSRKFGEQIVSASNKFGPFSDQVQSIEAKRDKAIDLIYGEIDAEQKKIKSKFLYYFVFVEKKYFFHLLIQFDHQNFFLVRNYSN